MKKLRYIGLTLALAITLNACDQEIAELENQAPPAAEPDCPAGASAGQADFSKYIAVGNSLTAGFQAGALFTAGQDNSVAKILADQFACVGGGAFNQPDINSANGFNAAYSNIGAGVILGRLILFDPDGSGPGSPTLLPAGAPGVPAPYNTADLPAPYAGDKTALNNFGVPGVTLLTSIIPQTGGPADPGNAAYNPYYARFASNPGTSTIIDDAAAALADGGTFFSFWLGNNDVLGYAVGGASNPAILTSETDFTGRLNVALGKLLGANEEAKGVVGNIPQVSAIPFFNTVPYNPVALTNETQIAQLNTGYAQYNGGLDLAFAGGAITAEERDRRKVAFVAGANPVVIEDESLTDLSGLGIPSYRMATATDRIVLPASSFIGTTVGGDPTKVNGVSVPLEDRWVLVPAEQEEITTTIDQFNEAIANAVSAHDSRLALADVNSAFNTLIQNRIMVMDNVVIAPSFQPPVGAFSEDAVHPNSRGSAFVANIFIDAINAKFGASVPKAKISKYPATGLPVNP